MKSCCSYFTTIREVVKTILHARDPLLGGGGGARQETMGLYRQVGGMGKRPWVCTDRWGGDG